MTRTVELALAMVGLAVMYVSVAWARKRANGRQLTEMEERAMLGGVGLGIALQAVCVGGLWSS